jgi:hypothetical protein
VTLTAMSTATPRLDDQQLNELLDLMSGADSVELKLTLPDEDHRSTGRALGVDPLDAEIRQVFFFDTPDLDLDRQGIVVRARRTQRKGDDSVVKLRPIVPDQLSPEVRADPSMVVEVDAMPGGFVCSASYKGIPSAPVLDIVTGGTPLKKAFSKAQRKFLAEHAPDGPTLDDLVVLGPLTVLKLRLRPEALGRKLVGELWLFPDGSRVVELSTKSAPADALMAAAETRRYLMDSGVDLGGEQATKTRKALEFFAGALG